MVRITRIDSSPTDAPVLKVEGQVTGRWATELSRVALETLADFPHVVLDLAGVTFVDGSGVSVLRGLRSRGVSLVNETQFVATILSGEAR